MPDRIVQLFDGTVVSFDQKDGKIPKNIQKWEGKPVSLRSFSEEQLEDLIGKIAAGEGKTIEK